MVGSMWLVAGAALLLAVQQGAAAEDGQPAGYESDVHSYNLAHGRVVFTDKCLGCHESGRRGAPVLGDTADWRGRLVQPLDTLIEHAIAGHGRMPPRGDQDLSDQEVAAAVAYVVHRARVIAAREGASLPAPGTGAAPNPADAAIMQMFLMLLGGEQR